MYLTKSNLKMTFNLDSFIYHYMYAVVFIAIYMLNNDHSTSSYFYTKIFNLITTILLLLLLFYKLILSNFKLKIKKVEFIFFIFILAIVMITYFTRQYINFHWIYLIYIYIYFNKDIQLNKLFKSIVLIIIFFSVLFQLLTLRFMDIRPVINWYDPNFSGFFLFVLFLFLKYEKLRVLSYIVCIAGFFTLSRSYILAVLIFFILNNVIYIKIFITKMRLNHFLIIIFISLISLSFIEKYFVSDDIRFDKTMNSIEKIYTLVDASNQDRFTANVLFKNDFIENFKEYQFGMNVEKYTDKIFRNTPHNAFYSIIINYGFYFAFFYFIIYAKIYDKFFYKENIPIIISLFSYYMLLGVGIQGFPGILVFYLLAVNKEKGRI